MKKIILTDGSIALVDDEDFESLSKYSWVKDHSGYAQTNVKLADGKWTTRKMARMIVGLDVGDDRQVDHINLSKLDNRRENLRVCTRAQNCQNRRASTLNTSGFKGVHYAKNSGRWRAKICFEGKRISLGLFDAPELAHEFYCLAADMLHGQFSNHGVTA